MADTSEHYSDVIYLTQVSATSERYANGTLSLFGADNELVGALHFGGTLTTAPFMLSALSSGGTEITYPG